MIKLELGIMRCRFKDYFSSIYSTKYLNSNDNIDNTNNHSVIISIPLIEFTSSEIFERL
jgi:hypothetical protein